MNLEDFLYWCNGSTGDFYVQLFRANNGAVRLVFSGSSDSVGAWCQWGVAVIFTKDLYKAVEKVQK